MGNRIWQALKHYKVLIFIFVISLILYFRLIDLWKSGLPYLYYTDEWHMLQPVVDFLSHSLSPHQFNHTQFYLFYGPGYYYTITYIGLIVHPILHLSGIVTELSDYATYYYILIFIARVANLGFLLITFVIIYRSARLIGLPLAGLIAILQVSVSYPVLRMAGYAKAETFTMMLVTISFYFFLRFWKKNYSQRDYFWMMIFAAIAVCAKLTAATYAGPIFLISAFLIIKNNTVRVSLKKIGIGLLLAVTAFVAFAPHSIFFARDMAKEAFSMLGDSYFNSEILGGAQILSVSKIMTIIGNFSDFFSSYYLLIFSLFLSLFFVLKADRILSIFFWLVVITICVLFQKVFLNPIYSYYTEPVYSVICLCMWYFVFQTLRNVRTFMETEIGQLKWQTSKILLSSFFGIILVAYLIIYIIRDAKSFYEFPYSFDIGMYADSYDCLKSVDQQIPPGARILFDSRSPKPNPYLYNTKYEFDMRYDLEKYRKIFSEYDYVFSGYAPSFNSAGFVRDAKINLAKGRLGLNIHDFFRTGIESSFNPTPYSEIARRWIEYYTKPLSDKPYLDWTAALDTSWLHNGLFEEWDMNHQKYPKNFESGGGTFHISRNLESNEINTEDNSIKLIGKNFIFIQNIKDYEKARGNYVTLFVQMKTSVPNKFGVQIYDGKGATISYHPGTGSYEVVAVAHMVDVQADQLSVRIVNAQDIGSEADVVEVRAAILLPGNCISSKDSQLLFTEWQKESRTFWSADISARPRYIMHWDIDWDSVDFELSRNPNQYFTYIPLSKIPQLDPVRHLAMFFPPYFKAAPDEEIIIEFQNISGVVLKTKRLKLNRRLTDNSLIVSEPLPFKESAIWTTNIANIKIIYRTKYPENDIVFPDIELY